jgi:hypothetical protein
MMERLSRDKEPMFQVGDDISRLEKGLYGLDPETSLLSVHFAIDENPYLNEHYESGQDIEH